jgi:hypothetical protein
MLMMDAKTKPAEPPKNTPSSKQEAQIILENPFEC